MRGSVQRQRARTASALRLGTGPRRGPIYAHKASLANRPPSAAATKTEARASRPIKREGQNAPSLCTNAQESTLPSRASFGGSRVYAWQRWASYGGSRVYGDLQHWLAVMGLVWWEPCLWGFAALVGSDGPRLWGFAALVGSSPPVMGLVWWEDLQLWSAVMGLVWLEPCLWAFAVLVGSDWPLLVGAVSVGICKLWSAVLGLVWWELSMGICSFGRQ